MNGKVSEKEGGSEPLPSTMLKDFSKLSLSESQVCIIASKKFPRKTEEQQSKNCKLYNIDRCMEVLKKGKTNYECFFGDTMTKLYLDMERDDYTEQPSNDELERIKEACVKRIKSWVQTDDKFDADKHIAIAQRHRWIMKRGNKAFKVSFRFWITRYKVIYWHIPYLLRKFDEDGELIVEVIDRKFDLSCYNKGNQIINACWNCKEEDLEHPLTPITAHDDKDFICQYLNGDEELLNAESLIKEKQTKTTTKQNIEKPHDDNDEEVLTLLKMLSVERANNYHDWIRVGWCLKNINEGMLSAWINWSKQSYKFVDGECEKVWVKADSNGGMTMGTLHYWAKNDNPQQYKKFQNKRISNFVKLALSGKSYDVANLIHNKYKGQYACASVEKKVWYYFDKHRWNLDDGGNHIYTKISTEIHTDIMNFLASTAKLSATAEDPEDKERHDANIKKTINLANQVKDAGFKSKVMTELVNLMYVSKFIDRLDEKQNLLGFNNGVYDLDLGVFRDGEMDDMVSKTVGYDYTSKVDCEIRGDILEFFKSIQDTEEMQDYLLDTLAIDLYGDIKKKDWIIFWIGNGGNGKGLTTQLFSGALGDYMYNPAIELFTTKRKSASQANPELAKAKGARATITTEPERDETIYVGLLKQWTGGDPLQARMLYGIPFEFIPQSKPTLQSNFKCLLSSADGGTHRRLKKIRFPYKFVDTPKLPFEKMRDTTISDKFKEAEYHRQFILLLLERFAVIKNNKYKIKTPKRVEEETNEYLNENNHFRNFADERLEENMGKRIVLKEAYLEFKIWAKESGVNISVSLSTFKDGIIGLGYEVKICGERGRFKSLLCIEDMFLRSMFIPNGNSDNETDDYN